jgi:hypothetical protein
MGSIPEVSTLPREAVEERVVLGHQPILAKLRRDTVAVVTEDTYVICGHCFAAGLIHPRPLKLCGYRQHLNYFHGPLPKTIANGITTSSSGCYPSDTPFDIAAPPAAAYQLLVDLHLKLVLGSNQQAHYPAVLAPEGSIPAAAPDATTPASSGEPSDAEDAGAAEDAGHVAHIPSLPAVTPSRMTAPQCRKFVSALHAPPAGDARIQFNEGTARIDEWQKWAADVARFNGIPVLPDPEPTPPFADPPPLPPNVANCVDNGNSSSPPSLSATQAITGAPAAATVVTRPTSQPREQRASQRKRGTAPTANHPTTRRHSKRPARS